MAHQSLAGVWRKVDWAKHHLSNLSAAIDAFNSSEKESDFVTVYPDFERKCFDFVTGQVREADSAWPAIVGDVAHNLRSALDHLVCQLVVLNGNSIDYCTSKKTCFPICLSEQSFLDSTRRFASLIDPTAFAFIKELQPYIAANKPSSNPAARAARFSNLWILSELDIIDKHRTWIIVARYHGPMEFTYAIDNNVPVTIPVNTRWRPLEDGTEIASIDISAIPLDREHKMRVQMKAEAKILFRDTGSCDGLEVVDSLAACFRHVSAIVGEFDRRFFSK